VNRVFVVSVKTNKRHHQSIGAEFRGRRLRAHGRCVIARRDAKGAQPLTRGRSFNFFLQCPDDEDILGSSFFNESLSLALSVC
jgi:hypothetical protein